MSFPPATEMFQFAGFASRAYGFSTGYPLRGGLPHSEIPGSPIARISPGLFAACHVLHRLSVPRHPPDALTLRLIPGVPLVAKDKTAEHRRAQGQDPQGDPQGHGPGGQTPKGQTPALGATLAAPARRPRMKTLLGQTTHRPSPAPGPVRLGHITTLSSPFNQPPPRSAPDLALGRPRHETVFSEPRSARLPAAHRRPAKRGFADGRNRVARWWQVPLVEVPHRWWR